VPGPENRGTIRPDRGGSSNPSLTMKRAPSAGHARLSVLRDVLQRTLRGSSIPIMHTAKDVACVQKSALKKRSL